MIEKGSMFKAWEATTEQQKKAHEMQAIYKAQETARQAIQEAMNRYIKKKTRARSVAKAEADPFAELEGWESLDQIQEAYGYGEITSDRRDKLTDLWEARETAQRKGKKDGKYHDLVTDMLARAIHSVGIEYADEIAAYEEERRMRRSYYEKVENRPRPCRMRLNAPRTAPRRTAPSVSTVLRHRRGSEAPGKNAPLDGQPRATRTEAPAIFRPEETASHPTGAREERTMQNEQPREHGRPGLPYCQHGPDPYAGRNPYRRSSRRERSGRTH